MGPLGGLGMTEIILIFVVILLLFGAKRIPEIGSALGKGIREFKGSLREIEGEIKGEDTRKSAPPASQPREVRGTPEPWDGEGGAGAQGGHAGGAPNAEPSGSDGDSGESDEGERRTLTTSD